MIQNHVQPIVIAMLFITGGALHIGHSANDDRLPVPATHADWRFDNPENRWKLAAYVERDPDSPLADKPITVWQGRGVGEQTLSREFAGDGIDGPP